MIAQTNLQLYAQLRKAGQSQAALAQVHAAYQFAAALCFPLFRGSGKPFSCHLVGVASLCALVNCKADVLVAALLHASYQARVSDTDSESFADTRFSYARQFGDASERLVYGCYIASFDARAHAGQALPEPDLLTEQESKSVRLILLADALEDALDAGLALHGQAGDSAEQRGSAAWRLARMQAERDDFLAEANALDCPEFASLFDALLAENAALRSNDQFTGPFTGPFTGQYSSFRAS